MTAIPAEDELVLRELGDERVHHARQVAFAAVHSALPLVRGAAFEDLGGDRELLGTSEPPCYRLQVTKKLIDLVPQRGGRAGIAR